MLLKTTDKLPVIFSKIDDLRRDITKLHDLIDSLLIGITSLICVANSWNETEIYAQKKEFLRTVLDLLNGIPPHEAFNWVFLAIDNKKFDACFIEWV